MTRFLLSLLFLCAPFTVSAETDPTEISPTERRIPFLEEEESGGRIYQELINMLFILGLIIGVMLLVAWILKKVLHTRTLQMNETSTIKVLEQRTLSPKSTVYLLEVQGVGIVVGETPAGLKRLGEVPLSKSSSSNKPPFRELLDKKMDDK